MAQPQGARCEMSAKVSGSIPGPDMISKLCKLGRLCMYVCVFTVHVSFESTGGYSFNMCIIHDIINFQFYFDVMNIQLPSRGFEAGYP